ncbi:MAG TPA: NRDE family protein [Gammaproteobacteria bacterium]|nr:NRDE family protein [Gammaproteobacteria bacterium]
MAVVAWKVAARFPLLLAANRDERHDRPSAPAAWWPDLPGVLGGRDLEAHGSWLAIDRGGRIAAVTNFREPVQGRYARSRGALVTGFLAGRASVAELASDVAAHGHEYGPFNLLLFDGHELRYLSNRAPPVRLSPGVHALSNAALEADWPKMRTARSGMEALTASAAPAEGLFELLARRSAAPAADRYRSAHFIDGPVYGTRCSTVITIDAAGAVTFA